MQTQRRLMAKDSFGFFFTVPRPKRPKHQVRPVGLRELRHPVDASMPISVTVFQRVMLN
jgi:hypothetical protein